MKRAIRICLTVVLIIALLITACCFLYLRNVKSDVEKLKESLNLIQAGEVFTFSQLVDFEWEYAVFDTGVHEIYDEYCGSIYFYNNKQEIKAFKMGARTSFMFENAESMHYMFFPQTQFKADIEIREDGNNNYKIYTVSDDAIPAYMYGIKSQDELTLKPPLPQTLYQAVEECLKCLKYVRDGDTQAVQERKDFFGGEVNEKSTLPIWKDIKINTATIQAVPYSCSNILLNYYDGGIVDNLEHTILNAYYDINAERILEIDFSNEAYQLPPYIEQTPTNGVEWKANMAVIKDFWSNITEKVAVDKTRQIVYRIKFSQTQYAFFFCNTPVNYGENYDNEISDVNFIVFELVENGWTCPYSIRFSSVDLIRKGIHMYW